MTRGTRPCFFSSLRSRRLAACLSRRFWTRTSSTTPSWSTARQSQCFWPPIIRHTWRVGRGSLTPTPSQHRAWPPRVIRLPVFAHSHAGWKSALPWPQSSSRTGWLWVAAEHCSPFGPVPLQNLPPSYELLRPCAPPRYSDPCGLSRLDVSLCIGATGSHVPYESLIRLRAASMPDVARAVFRTAPDLIPEARRPPGFDITFGISTRHQQFAFARLSGSYLTGLSPAFDCNAHHDRS